MRLARELLAVLFVGCQAADQEVETAPAPELTSLRVVSVTGAPVTSFTEVVVEVETEVAGGPLVGATSCSSIFDGMRLVLVDGGGGRVLDQPHDYTCSPYADDRRVELADGATRTTLRFAIDGAVAWRGTTAHLEGTLAGRPDEAMRSNDVVVVAR